MKIYCLAENTSNNKEFAFEHGLSLYIKTNGLNILFDMGQSDIFLKNAEKFGLSLSDVDFAILSHGHYDHGGGLKYFLEKNKKAKVYTSKYAFNEHYNGTEKYIGLDKSLKNNERIVFVDEEYKINDKMFLYSCNNLEKIAQIDSAGLFVKEVNFVPETFLHEQYFKVLEDNKVYLFSGCSHKGVLNIQNWFKSDVFIGGFHLSKYSVDKPNKKLSEIAEKLNSYETIYYTCHCTGESQYEYLKENMKDKINYLSSGMMIEI